MNNLAAVGVGVDVTVGEGVEVSVGVFVSRDVGVRVGKRVAVSVGVGVIEAEDESVFGPSSSSSNKDTPHDPVTHKTNKTKIASGKNSFLNMGFSYLYKTSCFIKV